MKFRITLDPTILNLLPEQTRDEIVAQLPGELAKTEHRIAVAKERIDRAEQEVREFKTWLRNRPATLAQTVDAFPFSQYGKVTKHAKS